MKQHFVIWIMFLVIFYFIGQYGRSERWFSVIHETGHVWAAQQEGKNAYMVSEYKTHVDGNGSYSIYVAGPWFEMIFWSVLGIASCFARWTGYGGMLAGFCFGFRDQLYSCVQRSTDFISAGQGALVQWRFWCPLIIAGMYLLLARRMWKWWKEIEVEHRRDNSKNKQLTNTSESPDADLR